MKHLFKGLCWSLPWWGSCAVYTYFHMMDRPQWYFSDLTIWLYIFVSGIAFTHITSESAHEEERRSWEAMHREVNARLVEQSAVLAPPIHSTNGHKEVSA